MDILEERENSEGGGGKITSPKRGKKRSLRSGGERVSFWIGKGVLFSLRKEGSFLVAGGGLTHLV